MMLKIFSLVAVVMCIGTDAILHTKQCVCKHTYAGYYPKYGYKGEYSWNSNGFGNNYDDDLPSPWNSYDNDAGFFGGPSNSWDSLGDGGWSYEAPQFNLRLPGLDGQYNYNVRHNVRHAVRHRIRHLYRQTGLENYRARSLRLRGLSGTRNYRVGHNVGHTVKHDICHKFRTVNGYPYIKRKSVCVCTH